MKGKGPRAGPNQAHGVQSPEDCGARFLARARMRWPVTGQPHGLLYRPTGLLVPVMPEGTKSLKYAVRAVKGRTVATLLR